MFKGQAKKDYQREYMRHKRSKERMSLLFGVLRDTGADVEMVSDTDIRLKKQVVRPSQLDPVKPQPIYKKVKGPSWVDKDGMVAVSPELDADGNTVPEY